MTNAISAKNSIIEELVEEHTTLRNALVAARTQLYHTTACDWNGSSHKCTCAVGLVKRTLKKIRRRYT